jgi:hypothetical protein
MNDPIVDELKKGREEYYNKFNGDLALIAKDIKKLQEEAKKNGVKFVKLEPKIYKKKEAA